MGFGGSDRQVSRGDWVGLGTSWKLVISVSRSRLGGRGWGVVGGVPSELGCGRVKESCELFVFKVVDIEVACQGYSLVLTGH